MKPVIFILSILLLSGCAKEQAPSHIAADNAVDTLNAIHEALPKECRTESNELLFKVAEREVRGVTQQCDNEKAKIEREKLRWKSTSGMLMLIIIIYAVKRFVK